MSSEEKIDERIEAWRKKWKKKVRADLFNNRKADLKAIFRAKRWEKKHNAKLEGRLFRVKEYHEIFGRCPTCCGSRNIAPPHPLKEFDHVLLWYEAGSDCLGPLTGPNGVEKKVISGQVVMATGEYLVHSKLSNENLVTSKYVEILTEIAVGFVNYEYLRQIKKSQIRELRKPK